jgi:dihydroorotate dehydrogenase
LSLYKKLLFPILSQFDPEKVHYWAMAFLTFFYNLPFGAKILRKSFGFSHPKLRKEILGLSFENPVGLAAGFDKNGVWINELSTLGFGFIEVGTVTPKPQDGNEKPRLFRLKKNDALINRMGFNNQGIEALIENLKKKNAKIIVGGNLGKNKITLNEKAQDDYLICFRALKNLVDYFVVNVSSPNTPGLRELQDKEPLMGILNALQTENQNPRKPILLKIAPDLEKEQLDDIIEILEKTHIDGVIATNTTIEREGLDYGPDYLNKIGNGGLSGKPVKDKSTEVIGYLNQNAHRKFVIVGVGGIQTAEDALEKINAGADLVQVYTGFIYEGPSIVKNINKKLVEWL